MYEHVLLLYNIVDFFNDYPDRQWDKEIYYSGD